jgi:hypothetical protein
LDSDLKALRMTHTQCVDTAILFPHPRGFPYRIKLKELAETYLSITIQRNHSNFTPKITQDEDKGKDLNNEKNDNVNSHVTNTNTNNNNEDENNSNNDTKNENNKNNRNSANKNKNKNENRVLVPLGHDSIEDASTAMRLVYLKLEKGPDFGSKIPLFGRIPLARFITGSGIIKYDSLSNVKINNNSDMDNQNLGVEGGNIENENKNRENNSENSKIPPHPLITFFWENNAECKTMNSCICEETVYNSPNVLEENLTNLREVFSFQEKKRISEDTVEITDNNNLLRNQILCYFGINSPNFSTDLTTIDEENKDKNKNMDEIIQKRKNENITNAEKMTKKIDYLKEILEKVKCVLKETKQGCLIIITAQPPMSIVSNLLKQKSACENPQTVSRWSKELDLQLKEAYSTCNIAHMITTTL